MKIFKMMTVALMLVSSISTVKAQETKQQAKLAKQKAKQAELKKMVDDKQFIFVAQNAMPMGGGTINLTSQYDLTFSGDTIVSFLPYFGRAFTAPLNPTEGGIKFTSTKFDYKPELKKNGSYDIVIKPQDAKDIRMLVLSLSSNGYGSLIVSSLNKQPITFYGRIDENKKKEN